MKSLKKSSPGFLWAALRASILLRDGPRARVSLEMPKDKRDVDNATGWPPLASRPNAIGGRFVLRLFFLTAGLFASAGALAYLLSRLFLPPRVSGAFIVPTAFAFSTAFLLLCSVALGRAQASVQRERQRPFRRSLLWALALGTAFVGVQAFGLWCIVHNLQPDRNAGEAELGPTAGVLGAAALHCLHVIVALMVLSYVTLQGFSDRYDHEYSFGVSVCTWFWHILGILWVFILGAYAVVAGFLTIRL
jgi:heme/copper-type cytochrome/quinol oxidase subunit 3